MLGFASFWAPTADTAVAAGVILYVVARAVLMCHHIECELLLPLRLLCPVWVRVGLRKGPGQVAGSVLCGWLSCRFIAAAGTYAFEDRFNMNP